MGLETRLIERLDGVQEQLYLLDIVGFDAQEPETKVLQANTVGKVGSRVVEYQHHWNCDQGARTRKGGLGRWVAKQQRYLRIETFEEAV